VRRRARGRRVVDRRDPGAQPGDVRSRRLPPQRAAEELLGAALACQEQTVFFGVEAAGIEPAKRSHRRARVPPYGPSSLAWTRGKPHGCVGQACRTGLGCPGRATPVLPPIRVASDEYEIPLTERPMAAGPLHPLRSGARRSGSGTKKRCRVPRPRIVRAEPQHGGGRRPPAPPILRLGCELDRQRDWCAAGQHDLVLLRTRPGRQASLSVLASRADGAARSAKPLPIARTKCEQPLPRQRP